jgi:HPt (histidine-containing phosphotransfer) domain-containing protein
MTSSAAPARSGPSEYPAAAPDAASSAAARVLDGDMIERLCGVLTAEMRAELAETFLVQVRACVAELSGAIRGHDRAECARIAHGLKGSSATVGASRLQLLCARLERTGGAELDPDAVEQQVGELHAVSDEAMLAITEALS